MVWFLQGPMLQHCPCVFTHASKPYLFLPNPPHSRPQTQCPSQGIAHGNNAPMQLSLLPGKSRLCLQLRYPHHWTIRYRDQKTCATLCICKVCCFLMSVQSGKICIRISINREQSRWFQHETLVSCHLQIPTISSSMPFHERVKD